MGVTGKQCFLRKNCSSLRIILEPDLYTATQHSPVSVKPQAAFVTKNTGLKVENITSVHDRLSTERES